MFLLILNLQTSKYMVIVCLFKKIFLKTEDLNLYFLHYFCTIHILRQKWLLRVPKVFLSSAKRLIKTLNTMTGETRLA